MGTYVEEEQRRTRPRERARDVHDFGYGTLDVGCEDRVRLAELHTRLALDADSFHGRHEAVGDEALEVRRGVPEVDGSEAIGGEPGDVKLGAARHVLFPVRFTPGTLVL